MLIDSNILIYSLNKASPKQHIAQAFLQSQKQLIFAQQNIFETIRILTHPRYPNPFPPKEAVAAVEAIIKEAKVIAPNFETADLTFELIKKHAIIGAETFDAYLVATAISNGVKELATDNVKHLQKYSELIKIVNPFSEI